MHFIAQSLCRLHSHPLCSGAGLSAPFAGEGHKGFPPAVLTSALSTISER